MWRPEDNICYCSSSDEPQAPYSLERESVTSLELSRKARLANQGLSASTKQAWPKWALLWMCLMVVSVANLTN